MVLAAFLIIASSCTDEERLPIVVLDTVEKGAYPRLISETNKLINLFNVAGSSYSYEIEFVDEEGGGLVQEYILDLVFDDNNPENGDNSGGPYEFLKFSSSEFTEGENGYLRLPAITITGPEALSVAGVTESQVMAGDNFHFQGRIILSDGRVFSQNNSSATVVGPAFRGHFNFTIPANCPSDLTGTYEFTNTASWCGTLTDGSVEIIALGGGSYSLSDWSLGSYYCYSGGPGSAWGNLAFQEVCAVVSFTGFTDSYGDTWEFSSSIDGDDWTISYVNAAWGETGTSVIHFPGGVPFVLSE